MKLTAFPSPEYERSSHPKAARIFTWSMAVLLIVVVGGTVLTRRETLTYDDLFGLIAPFFIVLVSWLFIMWMRRWSGVKWVPWAPSG